MMSSNVLPAQVLSPNPSDWSPVFRRHSVKFRILRNKTTIIQQWSIGNQIQEQDTPAKRSGVSISVNVNQCLFVKAETESPRRKSVSSFGSSNGTVTCIAGECRWYQQPKDTVPGRRVLRTNGMEREARLRTVSSVLWESPRSSVCLFYRHHGSPFEFSKASSPFPELSFTVQLKDSSRTVHNSARSQRKGSRDIFLIDDSGFIILPERNLRISLEKRRRWPELVGCEVRRITPGIRQVSEHKRFWFSQLDDSWIVGNGSLGDRRHDPQFLKTSAVHWSFSM
jgi:hypothetical protein